MIVVSRSGRKPFNEEKYSQQIQYERGDALKPQEWANIIQDADAVVSCVGCFGSNSTMVEVNGIANTRLAETAKEKFDLQSGFDDWLSH